MAIPIPPPTQRAATPLLAPLLFMACSSVTNILAPDAPIGCPIAMEPPTSRENYLIYMNKYVEATILSLLRLDQLLYKPILIWAVTWTLKIGPSRSLQLYISWGWIGISGEQEISDYSPDEIGLKQVGLSPPGPKNKRNYMEDDIKRIVGLPAGFLKTEDWLYLGDF